MSSRWQMSAPSVNRGSVQIAGLAAAPRRHQVAGPYRCALVSGDMGEARRRRQASGLRGGQAAISEERAQANPRHPALPSPNRGNHPHTEPSQDERLGGHQRGVGFRRGAATTRAHSRLRTWRGPLPPGRTGIATPSPSPLPRGRRTGGPPVLRVGAESPAATRRYAASTYSRVARRARRHPPTRAQSPRGGNRRARPRLALRSQVDPGCERRALQGETRPRVAAHPKSGLGSKQPPSSN